MQQVVIHDSPQWRVTSYGNGLAYAITRKHASGDTSRDCEVYLQGDDATLWREEWERAETAFPDKLISDIISEITNDYF